MLPQTAIFWESFDKYFDKFTTSKFYPNIDFNLFTLDRWYTTLGLFTQFGDKDVSKGSN